MRLLSLIGCGLLLVCAAPLYSQEAKVSFKEDKNAIEFHLNGKLATRYLFDESLSKPVFWPVLAPGETPVTRAWPIDKSNKTDSTDHIHQKSFWFCHGDVIPEKATLTSKIRGVDGVDFWSENKGHGVIRQTSKEISKKGNAIVLVTQNEWMGDKLLVLKEKRTMTFKEAPQGWVMVVESELTPGEHPVIFGDTKEGALGLRVHDQINATKKGNGEIRQPGGKKGEKECWGMRAPWCDYSGEVDGKKVGVTVFASEKNPVPTCWHVRGYGLMAANPFGRKRAAFPGAKDNPNLVRLGTGETLRLSYAVHVYSGNRSEPEIEESAKKVWQ